MRKGAKKKILKTQEPKFKHTHTHTLQTLDTQRAGQKRVGPVTLIKHRTLFKSGVSHNTFTPIRISTKDTL